MGISITGLSSNLDTAQMVKDLMAIEKIPYTNLTTKKTNLQSEQTIFRTINTKMKALESALANLKFTSDFNTYKTTSTNSNVATATVSSTGTLSGDSYSLKVTELAAGAIAKADGISKDDRTWLDSLQSGTVKINGKEVAIDFSKYENDKDALTALRDHLNKNAEKFGVKASLINTNSNEFSFILTSTETGSSSNVSLTVTPPDDPDAVPIDLSTLFTDVVDGKNAIFELNGYNFEKETNSISDVIDGITFNLTGKSTEATTISIARDTDAIVSKVNAFVTAYNDLSSLIKSNLAKPDNDDTTNPLQSDSTLKQLSNQLYSIFTSMVSTDSGNAYMEQMGLSIDKGFTPGTKMTGKITFDTGAFKSALESNPSKVVSLFTANNADADPNAAVKSNGIITQLNDIMSNYTSTVSGMLNSKITGYDSEIKMVDKRLEAMDRSLEMKELRLKQQFSTMETLLSSLKNEQAWLTSQFEALTKSK